MVVFISNPSVTQPVVPQNLSGNKVKTLRGLPILHRGDLKKCPGLLNCLSKFFNLQVSLETFLYPSSSSKGIFSCVLSCQRWSKGSPQLVSRPSGRSPRTILKCSILRYPDEAKKPPCLPVYWYTTSEEKLIQFRNL